VKQLIARIDDELHARIKAKAADEGRTMNEVVVRALEGATLDRLDESDRLLWTLEQAGLLSPIPAPPDGPVPTLDELLERNRGSGPALTDALRQERDSHRW